MSGELEAASKQLYCKYCNECSGPVEKEQGWYCEDIKAPIKLEKGVTEGKWPFGYMTPRGGFYKPSEMDLAISGGVESGPEPEEHWPDSLRVGDNTPTANQNPIGIAIRRAFQNEQ